MERAPFLPADGYRVFRQVVPRSLIERAIAAIVAFTGVDPAQPETWYDLPPENAGVVPLHHAPALWEIRQHPALHACFAEVWGTEALWVSMDRAAFRPPWRGIDEPPVQNDGWHRSLGNLHWDVDPRRGPPGCVQGVVLLTRTPAEAGGFWCVPEIYRDLDRWLRAHPDVDFDRPDLSAHAPVHVTGEPGDLIVWDPRLPHGPASNFHRHPRLAQYVAMNPVGDETARRERIDLFETRRAPACWRGVAGQRDPEPAADVRLTALGRRLVGLDPYQT